MQEVARERAIPRARRWSYLWDRERVLAPVMFLPAVIFIVVLVGFPVVLAILYAFSDVTVGDPSLDFRGVKNFVEALGSPPFKKALVNSFVFSFGSLALILVLATILAEVFTRDFRGKWLARFLFLLPWTTPVALGTIGWLWMLDSVFSPYDWIFRQLGLLGSPDALFGRYPNMYWLGTPLKAMISVILVHTWRVLPLATVIVIAGMTSIPRDIQDQAKVDGASYWMRLFQINIPLMLPVLAIAVLFAFVFTFTDMTVIYILTRGGPVNSTQVIPSWAFFKGIEGGALAQGAAIAVFLFPVLTGMAALTLRIARRSEVT